MQTQCPKCETRFRITDAQLDAAEGHVRCSICDEVFNARSNDDIADDITNDDAADSASDSPLDNNEIKESADNLSKDNLDEIDEDISLSEMNKLDIAKADDEQPDNKHFDNADQLEAESQPQKPTELDSETQPETQSTSSNQVVESDVEDEVEVDDQSQDKLEQYDNPAEQDANKIDNYDDGELNIAGTDEDGLDEDSIDVDNLDIDNLPQDNEDDENDVYLDETGDETEIKMKMILLKLLISALAMKPATTRSNFSTYLKKTLINQNHISFLKNFVTNLPLTNPHLQRKHY